MHYQDQNGGYPPPHDGYPPRDPRDPRDLRDPRDQPQPESQYPPPPGEEDDRVRAYHQRAPSNSSNVTLPSISPYNPQYGQQNGYNPDPQSYQQPIPYRGPASQAYRDERAYQQDYARGGPPQQPPPPPQQQQQQQMALIQAAPRQRTAIACRYCRRRKIRCSGFDQNPEGRCSNCQRFQQECIFTPVSSQAQAFVPAHTVFPGMRNMAIGPDGLPVPAYPPTTQFYGAHGQPLGSTAAIPPARSPYEYAAPSPTGSYNSTVPSQSSRSQDSAHYSSSSVDRGQPSRSQDNAHYNANPADRGQASRPQEPVYSSNARGPPSHLQEPVYSRGGERPPQEVIYGRGSEPSRSYDQVYATTDRRSPSYAQDPSRKRPQEDPHPALLPPPLPNQPPYARTDSAGRRQAAEEDMRLPPVTPTGAQSTSNHSPGSSVSSHSNLQPPGPSGHGLPLMSRTPPPRTSPGESRADPMSLGSIMERRPETDGDRNTDIDRNMLGRLGRPPRR